MNHCSLWYVRAGKWYTMIQRVILSDYSLTEIFSNILIILFILFNYNLTVHSTVTGSILTASPSAGPDWRVDRQYCALGQCTVIRMNYENTVRAISVY